MKSLKSGRCNNLAFQDPPSLKFHNRTDISMQSQVEVEQFCLPALLEIHRNPKQNDVKKCIGSIQQIHQLSFTLKFCTLFYTKNHQNIVSSTLGYVGNSATLVNLRKGPKDPYLPSLLNNPRNTKENIFDPQNSKEQKNRSLTFHKPWGSKEGG